MKINNKVEEGKEKVAAFARSLMERSKVPEDQREAEQQRLEETINERLIGEVLAALPDEDLDEIEGALNEEEGLPIEKWNSMMFMEGIKPESVVGKVFREVEREYLGAENVESEETLIQAEEEE